MPYYVSPEQLMKDRADYARKGIARGRSVVAVAFDAGVLFVAENPSSSLRKVSEIYDRIAFAAVGKYNEFEQLRVAGIRVADVRGYQYAREDVTGRSLANAYATALGTAFTEGSKPYEVELLVAEVGDSDVELFHILYDGSITDEEGFVAIGGDADRVNARLSELFQPGRDLATALGWARTALSDGDGLGAGRLEVAVLDRGRGRRKFRRLSDEAVARALESGTDERPR
ncbi:MAG: proteasome subunit alpha [Actinomycetota bacterium]|nr:proteasome subunit alpha [Actinomycetota bacterium]